MDNQQFHSHLKTKSQGQQMEDQNQYQYQMDEENYEECYDYQNHLNNYEEEYDYYPDEYNQNYYSQEPESAYLTQNEYQVLPANALFPEVIKHLKTTQEMTALPQGWSLLLLKQFRWDFEKLTDYYTDTQKYKLKIQYDPKYPLPSKQITQKIGNCQVCCINNIPLFANICNHSYCANCWQQHIKTTLQSLNPFPKCMGCQCPILMQTLIVLLQKFFPFQRKYLETYEKLICEQFSTIHRNYQFCTGADCGNCIKVYNLNLKSVKCTCGKVFCFKCKSDDHSPCTCEQKSKWIESVLKQQADAKWMSAHAKLCPWCKKAVERSAGCNFMACVCGKSFCYLCSRPWQPDHKDHFKCHIYKKSSTEQVSRQKQILQKMNFYTERFLDSQATAINNKRVDTFELRKLLFKTLKIELSDSQFIDAAYKFSIQCCECLKWIYAYTYYAKWKNSIEEESFKFDQGQFQKYKANLLKLLAVDFKNFMTKVQKYSEQKDQNQKVQSLYLAQFKQLKKTIVNYFTMTKKYKQKFLLEIENKNQQLIIGTSSKKKSFLTQKKESQKKETKNNEIQQKVSKQKETLQAPQKIQTRSLSNKSQSNQTKYS